MRILRFRWGQPKINKKIFLENGVIFVAICAVLLYNISVSGWKFVFFTRRGVAQVVARMVRVHEVVSSSLVTSTKLKAFSIGRSLFSLFFCMLLYKRTLKTEPWGNFGKIVDFALKLRRFNAYSSFFIHFCRACRMVIRQSVTGCLLCKSQFVSAMQRRCGTFGSRNMELFWGWGD